MNSLSEIKHRIKAVGDTRKITKAMEMVSIAKVNKLSQKCEQYMAYFGKMQSVMSDILLRTGEWVHLCLKDKGKGQSVFFVISSDNGLVGGFNHNLLNFALSKVMEADNPIVCTQGSEAESFFKKKGISVLKRFETFSDFSEIYNVDKYVEYFLELFAEKTVRQVSVIFSSFSSKTGVCPKIIKLLPIKAEQSKERYLYEIYYEPTPEEVLDGLIPQYLSGMIYGCLLQSLTSEFFSRRMAMDSAVKNADKLLQELSTEYNRARQNAVTNEISDIVTAVNGGSDERL